MTFEQLRYFQAAATLQHISRAAQQENISQSSMSLAIKKLEQELGVPLFQSNGRGILLTPAGERFAVYARELLLQSAAAKACMAEYSDRLNNEIHIAYTASLAGNYISHLFRDFLATADEHYLIYSDEMPSRQIEAGLMDGSIDFGICSQLEEREQLVQHLVMKQPLVLITAPDHPWAHTPPPAMEMLADVPFISYRKDYPLYRQIQGILQTKGVVPHIAHYAYSEDAIARLVEQGLGVSIIARIENLPSFQVAILRPDWLTQTRGLFLTFHKQHYLGKGAKNMMRFLMDSQTKHT